MEHFFVELRQLDETQERVEAVSDVMLDISGYNSGAIKTDPSEDLEATKGDIKTMVDAWMHELRTSDINRERIAFLYVANHVLHKTKGEEKIGQQEMINQLVEAFRQHMNEAVSLVSNSPMDRQVVMRLLELWYQKLFFSEADIFEMWKCTGEEIPEFLQAIAKCSSRDTEKDTSEKQRNTEEFSIGVDANEKEKIPEPELPMKLNAHSANPVLDALKQIDYRTSAIKFLNEKLRKEHQYLLLHGTSRYKTEEDFLNDRTTTCRQMKENIEDCLRLVRIRNKFMGELPQLQKQLQVAVEKIKCEELAAGTKVECKLEQCDMIDIGLADLSELREKYPEDWAQQAYQSSERRKKREEEQRQKDEEIARLQQEAIAESVVHAQNLESDMNQSRNDLTALSKGIGEAQAESEAKNEEAHEMVWHPVLKELVPLQSLNLEWEDWRDH